MVAKFAQKAERSEVHAALMKLAQEIASHMLKKQPRTKKEVRNIMGGKILELHSEKMIKKGKREGRKEGREAGRKEGRKEGRESTALNMLRDNMGITSIMKYTQLPEERILELAKTL